MTPNLSSVEAISGTQLKLVYKNGEKRTFDIKPWLNRGRFSELKNEKIFQSVRISFDTVEWPNGLDIDPEELYSESVAWTGDVAERAGGYG